MPSQTLRQQAFLLKNERLRRKTGAAFPLASWTATRRAKLKPGVKFDLVRHAYLAALYNCTAREMVVYKASQVGASEYLISYALHAADVRRATVIYLFPTDSDISDFSTARFGPAIEASPYLEKKTGRRPGVRGADRVKLKRVGDQFIYLRGAYVNKNGQAPQLKSVDADILIMDEIDEMDKRARPIARHRLDHSEIAEVRYVSTPTWAGVGIHELFLESDQREWFVRCDGCGHRQDMTIADVVTEWDQLDRPVAWHGQAEERAFVACRRCGAEVDRLGAGEWVAAKPGRAMVGFHLTKFLSPTIRLVDVVSHLDTVDETAKKEAVNQDLGLPYTPRGGKLTAAELDAARREYGHGVVGGAVAGVDVGSVLHVVIRAARGGRQLWAGMSTWDELGSLLRQYKVRTLVIDALPETKSARDFQASFRGSCFLAYYVVQKIGLKKQAPIMLNRADGVVDLDRTRTLDTMFAGLRDGSLTLPAHARSIQDYYAHLQAPVRRLVDTARGHVISYVEDAPDHLAHAENYCHVAAALVAPSLPGQDANKKEPVWN